MLIRNCSISFGLRKICFFFSFGVLLTSCDFFSNKILVKPIAQVENIKLTTKEFSQALAGKLKDLDALSAKDPKIVSVFKEQIINDFIVASLIDLWFEENKLSVEKLRLSAEAEMVTSSYPSDAAFREALTEAQMSYVDWLATLQIRLKKKILLEKLAEEAAPVSEEEVLSFYNDHKAQYEQKEAVLLSHILVADQNQADLIKKMTKQQKFEDVAKKFSSAYNAETKDVYGWIEKGFSDEFEKAFKLRPGDVFGPLTLIDGIHFFKLVEKKPAKTKTYAEVKAEARAEVLTLRETARFSTWLDVQIKRYKIKKNSVMISSVRVETQ